MKEGRTDSVDNSQKSHREGDRKMQRYMCKCNEIVIKSYRYITQLQSKFLVGPCTGMAF